MLLGGLNIVAHIAQHQGKVHASIDMLRIEATSALKTCNLLFLLFVDGGDCDCRVRRTLCANRAQAYRKAIPCVRRKKRIELESIAVAG